MILRSRFNDNELETVSKTIFDQLKNRKLQNTSPCPDGSCHSVPTRNTLFAIKISFVFKLTLLVQAPCLFVLKS